MSGQLGGGLGGLGGNPNINIPKINGSFTNPLASKEENPFQTIEDIYEQGDRTPRIVLVYGNEGVGKTHFMFTAPKPLFVLATEARTKIIMPKFVNLENKNDIGIVMCNNYDDVFRMAQMAVKRLKQVEKETGQIGSIGFDSLTTFKDYCLIKRAVENGYDGKDFASVKFSPRDDYGVINAYHDKVRDLLISSGYNIVFTSREKAKYNTENQFKIDDYIPDGKNDNSYAVDVVIRNIIKDGTPWSIFRKTSIDIGVGGREFASMDFTKMNSQLEAFKKNQKMFTFTEYTRMKNMEAAKLQEEEAKV